MKHVCLNCKKEFEGRSNKQYCSTKCRERQRFLRRKDTSRYRETQKIRDRRHSKTKKGKETRRKYQRAEKFRKYQANWKRLNKPWRKEYEKNPEQKRENSRKFNKTLKGKINRLKFNERRRKKIFSLTGEKKEKLNPSFIIKLKKRDKVCVFCLRKFNQDIHSLKETIDHFNCDAPLSETNAVICCWSCNASKRNIPLNEITKWIERKKFTPAPIVMKLLKIAKEKK